jgi:serine/threonine protein kinase
MSTQTFAAPPPTGAPGYWPAPFHHPRYACLSELGQQDGTPRRYSRVFLARDLDQGGMLVAIKQMRLAGLDPHQRFLCQQLFLREAALLEQLRHPGIPYLLDQFNEGPRIHLVLEYLPGETLETILRRESLSLTDICTLGIQLCSILEYLHAFRPAVIHRDIKPANIILRPDGRAALCDFGIARHYSEPAIGNISTDLGEIVPYITTYPDTLGNLGSVGYAAPEQYGDGWTMPCSDLYSLGAVLHQALSGLDPSEKPIAELFDFPELGQHVPLALRVLVAGLLHRNPWQRPQRAHSVSITLASVLEDLRAWYSPHAFVR